MFSPAYSVVNGKLWNGRGTAVEIKSSSWEIVTVAGLPVASGAVTVRAPVRALPLLASHDTVMVPESRPLSPSMTVNQGVLVDAVQFRVPGMPVFSTWKVAEPAVKGRSRFNGVTLSEPRGTNAACAKVNV